MPLPLWYKVQDGCWNCQHVFRRTDFEDESDYYCCKDGMERPLCDSHMMGEDHFSYLRTHGFFTTTSAEILTAEYVKLECSWNTWAKEHRVSYAGSCPSHEKSPCSTTG
jgi:hypothetical protein